MRNGSERHVESLACRRDYRQLAPTAPHRSLAPQSNGALLARYVAWLRNLKANLQSG